MVSRTHSPSHALCMLPLFFCILIIIIKTISHYTALTELIIEIPECSEDEIAESGGKKTPNLFLFLIDIWWNFACVSDFCCLLIFS